jgi:heptosyltransferase-3
VRKAGLIFGYSTRRRRFAAAAWLADAVLRMFVEPGKRAVPSGARRVLVSKIDHLGDLVLLARVMPHIRSLFPAARIDLLIGSWCRELAECIPGVNGIIAYDSLFHNRSLPFPSSVLADARSFRAALREIRKNRYDIGIEMRAGMVNGIPLMRLGGVGCIVGFATGGFGTLLDVTIPWRPVNEIDKYVDLLSALGVEGMRPGRLELEIPEENRREAGNLVTKKNAAILHPGCGRKEGWPTASWNALANRLFDAGWNIYITGTAKEYRLGEQVAAGIADAANLCGAMSTKTFLAVVPKAGLFVGLDSFPTHVSVACGVPTVLLFNPDTSEEFLPVGDFRFFPFGATPEEIMASLKS